jgi:D-alanine-D-alanine ligase
MSAREARIPVDSAADFGRVAVLMGGESSEREISLITGKAVHDALVARGVDAHGLDVRTAGLVDALRLGAFERVWNALHGGVGENGALQGLLRCLGLPFTGSDVLASAVGMDKLRSKQLFEAAGLRTPAWCLLRTLEDCRSAPARVGLPMAVKPNAEGSSVGVARVSTPDELEAAWRAASRYGGDVLAEQWIEGDEFTAGVLQGEVLPLIRIEASSGFYDYQAKYFSDQTRYHCPCGLPAPREAALAAMAWRAFEAVGASGWGRVDFMLDGTGEPVFLEINTVPGMTRHSLVPMAAREKGIAFEDLVWRILETSFVPRGAMSAAGGAGEGHDGRR